jgi:hypothetical protein
MELEEQKKEKLAHRHKLESQYPELGLKTKALLWSIAWENGHAYGYQEVSMLYHDYAELAQVATEEGRNSAIPSAEALFAVALG